MGDGFGAGGGESDGDYAVGGEIDGFGAVGDEHDVAADGDTISLKPQLQRINICFKVYKDEFKPMDSGKLWSTTETQTLVLPPPRKILGRPRKKRILEPGEGEMSTKISMKGHRMHCKMCKVLGHNQSTCPLKGEGKEAELAAAQAEYDAELAAEKTAYDA
ncbi:hypothetical protein ACFE04_003438 [Oxalis oulophora]